MTVITRFAPSPTGYLHIGGARTALFNWLYARHHKGIFHLRIEDTDRARSTQDAMEAILKGLRWLGLDWDDEIHYQHAHAVRHQEIAHRLLAEGHAYPCYCTPEELEEMRATARAEKRSPRYDRRCRDRDPQTSPSGRKPVIRLKIPLEGETKVADQVQGEVTVQNDQLDDFILLRADGTPTYMLSVVVDDHDMGVTHIIRGDDHLTNTFRQYHIYRPLGWTLPQCSHIPLIHGPDGAKLSKRHGALGVEAYEEMGMLSDAMCNYLLRLGWSHGDDEIISRDQGIQWFNLDGIGKSPSRFDLTKLTSLNGHYMRHTKDEKLVSLLEGHRGDPFEDTVRERLLKGMSGLKERAKTLVELAESAGVYTDARPLPLDEKAKKILTPEACEVLKGILPVLEGLSIWTEETLEEALRAHGDQNEIKFGKIAQPLRAALTGRGVSPGIFEVMVVLGKEGSLGRLSDVLK